MSEPGAEVMARFLGPENVDGGRAYLEGLDPEKSQELFNQLYQHAKSDKYTVEIEWVSPGDLVIWDNTCTMHRAVSGQFLRKYRRDMRRATVHDSSSQAWGLNEHTDVRQGLP